MIFMDAKLEMKQVRDWLRRHIKQVNADPYLAAAHNRIEARIVKWNRNSHSVLVCVRITDRPFTQWDSEFCRWVWVDTDSQFRVWHIWKALNDIIVNERWEKNHS